jgi:protoheme IX farnesyltransferase
VVLGLLIWAWRGFPKGHVVRLGAVLSSVFIITEALVGAGLVLFGWTAQNASAVPTAIHLVNTFLLLASLALTGYWASGGGRLVFRDQGLVIWALAFGLLGVLFVGVSGAITALGDTLFPASSLAEGLRQDFETGSHFLIRLRVWHPVIAILVGLYLIFVSTLLALLRANPAIQRAAVSLAVLFVLQLAAGLVNVLLLAPVWMQIIHLLLADIVWITLVLLTALTVNRSEVERLEFEASQSLGVANPQGINSLS